MKHSARAHAVQLESLIRFRLDVTHLFGAVEDLEKP
jgi:hypothetical protein